MSIEEKTKIEVTDFDMRNIMYFARCYACNACPFDDLVQEGWLAAATAQHPTHKYLRIRQAIQQLKKKATYLQTASFIPNKAEESDGLMQIDNLDQLTHLLLTTELTSQESRVINYIYFKEIDKARDVAEKMNISAERVRQLHQAGLNRLARQAREEAKHEG